MRKWFRTAWATIALAALCLAGGAVSLASEKKAAEGKPWADADVVLQFKDEHVTYRQARDVFDTLNQGRVQFESLTVEQQREFIATLGRNRLMAKEARARSLDKSEEFHQRFLPWYYGQLSRAYVQREFADKIKLTDEQVLQYIAPALPQVQVRVIVKEDEPSARRVYEQARSGADFSALAAKESEGRLRDKEGLTGWLDVSKTQMFPPPVVEKFLAAEVGTIFEPFFQDIGFLVVKVEGKMSAEELRLAELNRKRGEITLQVQREAYQKELDRLRTSTRVVRHEEAIDLIARTGEGLDEPVLEVGEEVFLGRDILADVARGQHGAQPVAQKLDSFVDLALVGQEAQRLGFDKDVRQSPLYHLNEEDMLARVLAQAVGEDSAGTQVDEKELREYYDANPNQFTVPEMRRLRICQLRSASDAEKALVRLRKGEEFASVAKELSCHKDSAAQGGDIGFIPADKVPEPVREAVAGLKAGEFTQKAVEGQTTDGQTWLVVKVEEVRKPALTPFDSVERPTLEDRVLTRRRAKALSDLKNTLEEKYGYKNCFADPR